MLAFRENYLARDACKVVSLVVMGKAVRALLKSWITQKHTDDNTEADGGRKVDMGRTNVQNGNNLQTDSSLA